jgi:hypothetical protein
MSEADWHDSNRKFVGKRCAKREAEQELKKMDKASNAHVVISTQTPPSSAEQRSSLLRSIGRKRSAFFTNNNKLTKPKPTKANGKLISSPFRIPGPGAIRWTGDATIISQTKSLGVLPAAMGTDSVMGTEDMGCKDSLDRLSKGIRQPFHR